MAKNTAYLEDLGACDFCNNCIKERQPWYCFGLRRPSYYCANGNDCFARIRSSEQCEDFVDLEEDYYDGADEPEGCRSGGKSLFGGGSRHEEEHEDWSWDHDDQDGCYYDPDDDYDE